MSGLYPEYTVLGVATGNAKIEDKMIQKVQGDGRGSTCGFKASGDFVVSKGGSFYQEVRGNPSSGTGATIMTSLSGNKASDQKTWGNF